MDEKMLVTFYIAGKPFKLNINRADEEFIRKAAKQVDQRFAKYKERFDDHTVDDTMTMSMVAFHFAYECLTLKKDNNVEQVFGKLENISSNIDSFFIE